MVYPDGKARVEINKRKYIKKKILTNFRQDVTSRKIRISVTLLRILYTRSTVSRDEGFVSMLVALISFNVMAVSTVIRRGLYYGRNHKVSFVI